MALQQKTWGDLGRVHARMPVLLGGQWFTHLSRWQTSVFPVLVQHSSPHTGPVLPSFSAFWPGSLKISCNFEPATTDPLCSSTCSWPSGWPSLFAITKLNSLPLGRLRGYTAASNERMCTFFFPRGKRWAIVLTEVHWDLPGLSGLPLTSISEGLFNIKAQRGFWIHLGSGLPCDSVMATDSKLTGQVPGLTPKPPALSWPHSGLGN